MADKDLEFEQTAIPSGINASGPHITLSEAKEAEYERITRNLQEATSMEIVRKVLAEDRVVKCYWGE